MSNDSLFDGVLENAINTGLKTKFKNVFKEADIPLPDDACLWSYPQQLSDYLGLNPGNPNRKWLTEDEIIESILTGNIKEQAVASPEEILSEIFGDDTSNTH